MIRYLSMRHARNALISNLIDDTMQLFGLSERHIHKQKDTAQSGCVDDGRPIDTVTKR